MIKEDIFDYVMQTRYNTNPNHLASMLTNLEEAITKEVEDDVEENIEDYIPADKKLVDKDAEILPADAAGCYYTIEGSYDSSTSALSISPSLTEENLVEYFSTGIAEVVCTDTSFILTGYDDALHEFTFKQVGGTAVCTIVLGDSPVM